MITVDEAIRRVLEATPSPRAPERVSPSDALGRVLAEQIVSREDAPPFARATMDGWAVRVADLETIPAELLFSGETPAGSAPGAELPSGGAFKVMTGAPVPSGTECVVPIEKSEPAAFPGFIRILDALHAGANVAPAGSEVEKGEILFEPGRSIVAADVALLSLLGHVDVPVWPKPRVAVLSTGDELVPAGSPEPPPPGKIRNSNGPMLVACLASAGTSCRVRDLGIARDDALALRVLLREGLRDDVLIISGGVSAGEHDLVADALRAEGVDVLFHKIAMKPGKPLLFGRRQSTLVFGLPGNPLSSFVGFQLFVVPALRALSGGAKEPRARVRVIAADDCPVGSDREEYRPARLFVDGGEWRAKSIPWRGSAHLVNLCRANALHVMSIGAPAVKAASPIEVIPLGGSPPA
ncbi:MAG: molybdopterin molybdotransferase MoeA [Planctomycetes bacterium]|nr:molybdopterin molybdotransferase MoeA [Planctomycetota bacterium]MBI3846938.1 molybdopterin molybdotransferase MoeA [Planctomycetota bacterium]